jgi:hypothetical protein
MRSIEEKELCMIDVRRFGVGGFVLLVAACVNHAGLAQQRPATEAQRLVDKARQQTIDGDTDDAEVLIRRVVALHGDLNYKQYVTIMYVAIDRNQLDIAKLLLDLGASPDVGDNDGYTPLMKAILNGNADGVDLLLSRKANPDLKTRTGESALKFALQAPQDAANVKRIVASLRKAGARQ